MEQMLESVFLNEKDYKNIIRKQWKIPVCYEADLAWDLKLLSSKKNIPVDEIISLHSSKSYVVFFVGFLPGFLYLGGLDPKLHFPRRASPRERIFKGAVAIGGSQTGIYPNDSPGGWHIIGNTPVNMFDPLVERPCFAQPLDQVKFVPVTMREHQNIKKMVENGIYVPKSVEIEV